MELELQQFLEKFSEHFKIFGNLAMLKFRKVIKKIKIDGKWVVPLLGPQKIITAKSVTDQIFLDFHKMKIFFEEN